MRAFEIVLEVPQQAAHAWFAQRGRGRRARVGDTVDAALAAALADLPLGTHAHPAAGVANTAGAVGVAGVAGTAGAAGVAGTADAADAAEPAAPLGARAAGSDAQAGSRTGARAGHGAHGRAGAAIRGVLSRFDSGGALAAAGLQVRFEPGAQGARFVVLRRGVASPGVAVIDTLHDAPCAWPDDTAALPVTALTDSAVPLKDVPVGTDTLGRVARYAIERVVLQRHTVAGVPVGIVYDYPDALDAEHGPALREIRVSTPGIDDVQALFAVADDIVAALPAFPVLASALEREDHGDFAREGRPVRAAPIDLTRAPTPHAALVVISDELARHWFGNDAGVRADAGTEFTHQIRVAQRRLRTAMRLFPDWVDAGWQARIAPDLEWLGDALGAARDWDVFVDTTLPGLIAADVDPSRWQATREAAHARRLEARAAAQAALGSARYARLALAWLAWLQALPGRAPPKRHEGVSLRAYAKARLRKSYKRLAAAPNLTTLDEALCHKERIHAKYLRYALEFFASVTTPKTRSDCAKTVSRVQSVLGDGNDAAVALRYLALLDVDPYQAGFARGWCQATQRYTTQEGERLLRTVRKPRIAAGNGG